MTKQIDVRYTQNRELSWLRFNERVLDEAADEEVPLFERLKFTAIFTGNLDEFYMIRVGSLTDMALLKQPHVDNKSGMTPAQQLRAIFQASVPLYARRDATLAELEHRLRTWGICRLTMDELDGKQRKQVDRYCREFIFPVLSPIVVDSHHPFPHLPSKSLTVALALRRDGKRYFGLVPVPKTLPPFYLPEEGSLHYLLTEHILLSHADALFDTYEVLDKAVISVTRNADISPEDEDYDVEDDFRVRMKNVLKKRSRLAPVRLEIQDGAGDALVDFLCKRLGLEREQVFTSRTPLVMEYVYALEGKLPPQTSGVLCYPSRTPCWPGTLSRQENMIPQILRDDVLLYYPYHSMEPFLRLIRQASADPAVLSIRITIYRLASNAKLVDYLCAAAENGKDVTVLMELRARFDEQNNIRWAERLEQAGCTLLYGPEGYKVHSKICLITRRERGRIQYITQIGTGNYNEKTARMYTDFSLMTANPAIGADAAAFFQNMATTNLTGAYQKLLVAPSGLKPKLLELIDGEMAKAAAGKGGFIFLKVNSVTDRQLIDKLAQASQAGVEIVMNVRGICCLVPGVPGLTDRIKVFSVVGRFLEHPRVYCFGQGDDARIYLSSADLMTRNTERRVEIACPVMDPRVRHQLRHDMQVLCADNTKARILSSDGTWQPVPREQGSAPVNAQAVMLNEAQQDAARTAAPQSVPQTHSGVRALWDRAAARIRRSFSGKPGQQR